MPQRFKHIPDKVASVLDRKMRYFIFYPPSDCLKLIDVSENDRVEEIIEIVKDEFGLKYNTSGSSETTIVLSYNGSDLKSNWSFGDLNIPSGSIIRCISKQQTAADLYIHCGFNKQIFKLYDSSITIETTIGMIRKKICDKLGLPLSTFCLETYDGKQRLYDEMKLMNYDIKVHDHLYLKVWKGYEKFINACVKGFTERFSHDDLIRHYQSQVALYIAAFYSHLDLAKAVMEHGARSDRPVGEHPSRQWTSETSMAILPDMHKCPIHVAIERGHIKMVDLFVRQSPLCTQARDPIGHHLPYQLANYHLLSAATKEEKQRYSEIYFFLKDKQFNLKIPINANGEYVASLLSSTATAKSVHHVSAFFVYVSLPIYCKIINWYERARERAWKKYGGRFHASSQMKRVYPETGLLGYKVLIDGYNNKFEVPSEQLRPVRSGTIKADLADQFIGCTPEEKRKLLQMKSFMKQFALDDRRRAKIIAAAHLQHSRRPPTLLSHASIDATTKHPTNHPHLREGVSASSEFSSSQVISTASISDFKRMKSIMETDDSSVTSISHQMLETSINLDASQTLKGKQARMPKLSQAQPRMSVVKEEDKHKLPMVNTPVTSTTPKTKLDTVAPNHKLNFLPTMSSIDAFLTPSNHMKSDIEKRLTTKPTELVLQTQPSIQQQHSMDLTSPSMNQSTNTLPVERGPMRDLDSYIPLPEHPNHSSLGPVQSRIDVEIRKSTIDSYERYASASTRSTAIDCLQEASFFKKKTWIKKVQISKDMIKSKVHKRIRRAAEQTASKPLIPSQSIPVTSTTHKLNTVHVN